MSTFSFKYLEINFMMATKTAWWITQSGRPQDTELTVDSNLQFGLQKKLDSLLAVWCNHEKQQLFTPTTVGIHNNR